MQNKRILLVVPSFTGNIDFRVHDALEALIIPEGYELEKKIISRKLIHIARNEAVKDCIVGKFDYLLFCDDDNAPKADALKLLLEADKAIVGGIIRKRNGTGLLAVYEKVPDGNGFRDYKEIKDIPEGIENVFQVGNIGTGFTLYKADLLKKVYVAYDYCPFENKLCHFVPTITGERVELERFLGNPLIKLNKDGTLQVMRQLLSEDLLFHERCFMGGFKIYAHSKVTLEHYSEDGQIFTV